MDPSLLDSLACPLDKSRPLAHRALDSGPDGSIRTGLLRCEECGAVYPVLRGVPHLVRPGLRLVEREQDELGGRLRDLPPEWSQRLTDTWPRAAAGQTDEDRALLAEGRYWSDHFKAHHALGDLTIFDARVKGTHPPYLGYGFTVTDARDQWRAFDSWPNPLGRRILRFHEDTWNGPRKRCLDFLCGGGQWGIEAAWRGARTIGFDIAVDALELAREYAATQGLDAHYVYAEPLHPPFADAAFDAMVVKDGLHHMPDVRATLREAARIMKPGAGILLIEHVADKPRWERLGRKILEFFAPALERRYERIEPPQFLQSLSPREGAGLHDLESRMGEFIEMTERRGELLFADEFTLPLYLAWGRRRFPAEWLSAVIYCLERLALLWGRPRFLFVRGRFRSGGGGHAAPSERRATPESSQGPNAPDEKTGHMRDDE